MFAFVDFTDLYCWYTPRAYVRCGCLINTFSLLYFNTSTACQVSHSCQELTLWQSESQYGGFCHQFCTYSQCCNLSLSLSQEGLFMVQLCFEKLNIYINCAHKWKPSNKCSSLAFCSQNDPTPNQNRIFELSLRV